VKTLSLLLTLALGCIVILTLSLLVASLTAEAQQPTKVHRIGMLTPAFPPSESNPPLEAFRQGLRELGYIQGDRILNFQQ
jgi:putative ABC transport system substrate-binding protein